MSLDKLQPVHVEPWDITVDYENHEYTDFVTHYVDDNELPTSQSDEFEEDFVVSMNEYLDDKGRDPTDVHEYAASVGVREAAETNQVVEDVLRLNKGAAIEAVFEDRGPLRSILSTLSPFGHGFANPHRKEEDVCVNEIRFPALEGFRGYREQQLGNGF